MFSSLGLAACFLLRKKNSAATIKPITSNAPITTPAIHAFEEEDDDGDEEGFCASPDGFD